MKVYVQERIVRRNSLIGRVLVFGGLAVLVAGFVLSLQRPEAVNLVLVAALVGTVMSQLGMALVNRWGRHPRMDEVLSEALKGLDKRFTLIHYALGVPHALLGPGHALALVPVREEGVVTYEEGRWIQDRPRRGIFRRGGRRDLGDLEKQAVEAARSLQESLERAGLGLEDVEVQAVLVFIHPGARVQVRETPVPAVHIKKLKDWVRRNLRGKAVPEGEVKVLAANLGLE